MNISNYSNEYVLSQDIVILSTSDLKGNIVEYNEAFKEASGYSDDELQGRAHNLLRHPDMPKEAFKDFWQTIEAGYPWFGMVKNKRKNGQYYWVAANVSPIKQSGRVTGYVSVRYPASEEQKRQAESLYQQVNAGQASFPFTRLPSKHKSHFLNGMAGGAIGSSLVLLGFNLTTWGVISLPFAMLGLGYLMWSTHRKDQFNDVVKQGMESLANGEFATPLADKTELGCSLNMIRSRIAEAAAKNYDARKSAQILMTAMNTASTNMMVADVDFTIKSINASLKAMFERNEPALKTALPNFDASRVVGSNMDIFHKNPAHQRQMVNALNQPWAGELEVAGLILRLTVVPIYQSNKKIGYVVEWLDRTNEANLSREIVQVMQDMESGKFSSRVSASASGELALIKNSINNSMEILSTVIASIREIVTAQAAGDLTVEFPKGHYKGEVHDLKNSISYSIEKLKQVVVSVSQAANTVSGASNEVSQGSLDLSQSVQQQAAALEQTSATMEQMTAAVKNNTQNALQTAQVAKDVQLKANQGVAVMEQTIAAMNAIQQSSHKIADIVSLIDGIAFQTNLLALNAAVEAARAGEHGRGFAVVASEVRALAQKSAEAAKDIKHLIAESVARIDQGTQLASASGEVLQEINLSIDGVTEMISQIAQASSEQADGISQVHKAISQIDGVTQQNAALVEQTSATAESLSEQSSMLMQEMSFFKTGESYTEGALLKNNAKSPPGLVAKIAKTVPKSELPKLAPPSKKTNAKEWSEF
jgi:methyl-accepting chemotaxis protein